MTDEPSRATSRFANILLGRAEDQGVVDACLQRVVSPDDGLSIPVSPSRSVALSLLADAPVAVRGAVARNTDDLEVQKVALRDSTKTVRAALMANPNLHPEVADVLWGRVARSGNADLVSTALPHLGHDDILTAIRGLQQYDRDKAVRAIPQHLSLETAEALIGINGVSRQVRVQVVAHKGATDDTFDVWAYTGDTIDLGRDLIGNRSVPSDHAMVDWMVDVMGYPACQPVTPTPAPDLDVVDRMVTLLEQGVANDVVPHDTLDKHCRPLIDALPGAVLDADTATYRSDPVAAGLYDRLAALYPADAAGQLSVAPTSRPWTAQTLALALSTAPPTTVGQPTMKWHSKPVPRAKPKEVHVRHVMSEAADGLDASDFQLLLDRLPEWTVETYAVRKDLLDDTQKLLARLDQDRTRKVIATMGSSTIVGLLGREDLSEADTELLLDAVTADDLLSQTAGTPLFNTESVASIAVGRLLADKVRGHTPTMLQLLDQFSRNGGSQSLPRLVTLTTALVPPPDPTPTDPTPTDPTPTDPTPAAETASGPVDATPDPDSWGAAPALRLFA